MFHLEYSMVFQKSACPLPSIAASSTISWRDYSQVKAKVVACVIHDHFYTDAHSHFQDHGVTLHGYIQWKPASSRS